MDRRKTGFYAFGFAVVAIAAAAGFSNGQRTEWPGNEGSGVVSLGRPAMVETWGCDPKNSHLVYNVTVHVRQNGSHKLSRIFHLATAFGTDILTQKVLNIPLDDGRILLVSNRWPNKYPEPPFEWHPIDKLYSRDGVVFILDRSTNPPEIVFPAPDGEFSVKTEVSEGVWSCAQDFPLDSDQIVDFGRYNMETKRNFGKSLMAKFIYPNRTELGQIMVFKGAEHLMP